MRLSTFARRGMFCVSSVTDSGTEYRVIDVSPLKHINRIEYGLANETYTGYDIGNTSDTQEEIRQLTAGVNEELKAAYGNPAETDKLVYDEDSFYNVYKVSDSCFINVEFRDFTEEGGNGLLSVDIIFADCEDLKYG